MDDVLLVQTVLDLTSLSLADSLAQIGSHSAGLGVGHQATGAQNLTQTANAAHHIGGSHDDVKIHEAAGDLCDQLVIANDISASSLGSSSCGALSNSADADGLAGAVGQNDSAADLLVSVTAINAQTDVQLDSLVELGGSGLASQLQSLVHIVCLSRIDQLCSVDIVLAMFHCISSCVVMRAVLCPPTVYVSALDGDTHGTAGAANHAACSFQRSSVQVGHLGLGDLFHLSGGQSSDLFLVGLAGSGVDASGLLDQNSCRRSLGDEAEGAVSVHGDDDGDHITHLVLGTLVELLGERHDVDALLTQSRANRGSRSRLAGLDLQLNVASNFLCHDKCTSKNLW